MVVLFCQVMLHLCVHETVDGIVVFGFVSFLFIAEGPLLSCPGFAALQLQ